MVGTHQDVRELALHPCFPPRSPSSRESPSPPVFHPFLLH